MTEEKKPVVTLQDALILIHQLETKLWEMENNNRERAKQNTLLFNRVQELEMITAHQRNSISALQSEVFRTLQGVDDRVKFAVVAALSEHSMTRLSLSFLRSIWKRLR